MTTFSSNKQLLSIEQAEGLLVAIKDRFEKNMHRHEGLNWAEVQAKLGADIGTQVEVIVGNHTP